MRKKTRIPQELAGEESGIINLTPLIDVVFVVLIMFIVVAPMLEIDRVSLATSAAPQENKQHPTLQQDNSLMIYVHADNSIWFHSKMVKPEELFKQLLSAKKSNPRLSVKLFHDKKAHFGTYQMVKNSVESAGFEEMDVILQPGS